MICKNLSSFHKKKERKKDESESQWSLDFSINGLQMWSVGEKKKKTAKTDDFFCDFILLTMFIA